MDVINAIAKARFSSAKAQRVQLHTAGPLRSELLCIEAGQHFTIDSGVWAYYVVTGTASITVGDATETVPAGQLICTAPDEHHRIEAAGESRAVCLAIHCVS
jgi:hypothetical protein